MKAIVTTIALTIFAGTAAAASDQDVYAGFAGNPDLGHDMTYMQAPSASQPGIGDSTSGQRSSFTTRADIYRGFEKGNSDL